MTNHPNRSQRAKLEAALRAMLDNTVDATPGVHVHWPDSESDPEGTPLREFARRALGEK